jgi:two-component system response regulator YesN
MGSCFALPLLGSGLQAEGRYGFLNNHKDGIFVYRAFIIDDEPSVIEGLKFMIPWESLGFELCGEAMNCRGLGARLAMLRPHLIVTDIRMPEQSGLDLISELRKTDLNTEIVILSGYPEFVYAQRAIRLNVSFYLLKPLDVQEFSEALQKMRIKLDAKLNSSASLLSIKPDAGGRNNAQGIWQEGAGLIAELEEKLKNAVSLMNLDDSLKTLDEMFYVLQSVGATAGQAQVIVNSAIFNVLFIAFERNVRISQLIPQEPPSDCIALESLKAMAKEITTKTVELLLEVRRQNSKTYLQEAKSYIEENFDEDITVLMLARKVYVDPKYLGKVFHDEFGCSIRDYQHRLRISKAIELLCATSMSFGEIATAVGYNQYNKFFSHFLKVTGKKPNQYKQDKDK